MNALLFLTEQIFVNIISLGKVATKVAANNGGRAKAGIYINGNILI
jgi:hypothetical protein